MTESGTITSPDTFPGAKKRVRILQLFSRYRAFGGEEGSVNRIRDALLLEFDVGIFQTSSGDAFGGNPVHKAVSALKAFSNWSVVRQLRDLHQHDPRDIWLVHNVFPAMSPAVYELAFHLDVPVIQYLHNYRMGCVNGFFLNHGQSCQTCMKGDFRNAFRTACWHASHLQSGLMGMITARARAMDLFHRIHHWIAISEAQKLEHVAMGIPSEKITIIPHFYEHPEMADPPYPDRGDALFVGRLSAEKGIDRLLRAWKLIQDCGRMLWIVGEGPERPRLEAMVREGGIRNIRFTGFLNHQEMKEIWSKSACSVVPSIWKEPFGMVVLEAWAKGRPVVAHHIGALPEIITDGADGLLVPEDQPEQLGEAILSLLQNPVRAERMGHDGRKKLREKYSRKTWADAIRPVLSADVRARG
jgi:glycosyltransferase involved in cell wall biosynthesis